MVALHGRVDENRSWFDLGGIAELRELCEEADGVLAVGAGVPLAKLQADSKVRRQWPNLAASASQTGASAIQNLPPWAGISVMPRQRRITRLPCWSMMRIWRLTGAGNTSLALPRVPSWLSASGTTERRTRDPDKASPNSRRGVALLSQSRNPGRPGDRQGGLGSCSSPQRRGAHWECAAGLFQRCSHPEIDHCLSSAELQGKITKDIGLERIRVLLAQDIVPQSDIRSSAAVSDGDRRVFGLGSATGAIG